MGDPGDRKFEGNNPGAFYTLLSRVTTLRNLNDLKTSAIYFTGTKMCADRIMNITKASNGNLYKKVEDINWWVKELNQNTPNKVPDELVKQILHWTEEEIEEGIEQAELAEWVEDSINMR